MSKRGESIGAVIIAKNEEEKIAGCLESITKWVDEVIVVDGGSIDRTREIAKSFGAKVVELVEGDFSERRTLGTDKVSSSWVLHIDADERVTPELKREILNVVGNVTSLTHFAIPRINYVFNKRMKHCGLWPDYVVRLFRKDSFVSWRGALHEQPVIKGKLGYLESAFVHIKHDNLFDIVKKTNSWSNVEADLMLKAGHPPMNVPRFLSAMFREFWLRMIKQKAFLDGVEGVVYGIYQVYSRFLSYAKLWEMQIK